MSFGLSASSDTTSYECSLDAGTWAPCFSSPSYSGLAEGNHNLAVRAIDRAGNVDPTPAVRRFSIDRSVTGARLRGHHFQRFRGELAVKLRAVLGESGSVRVRARLRLGKRAFSTKRVEVSFDGAGKSRLVLRARPATDRRLARALRDGRVKAKLTATFFDALGNRKILRRSIVLR